MHTLYPHQEQALYEYAKGRSRIALFMEMRLGKSVVAIRWIKTSGQIRRVLLLAPLAAIPDWCKELDSEGEYFFDLTGLERRDRVEILDTPSRARRTWYLLNYESFRGTDEYHTDRWDAIVADESSMFRNPKAKLTKIMVNNFHDVKYKAALTGTPNPESPLDYYSQMEFLHGSFCGFHNFWSFRHVLFRPDRTGYGWIPKSGTRDRIKSELDLFTFQLTKKQAKVGPKKVYERQFIEPTPEQVKAFEKIKKDFAWEDLETIWAPTRELWLARVAGGFSPDKDNPRLMSNAKTLRILELLNGELKKQSVVIWFRFLEEMKHVAAQLAKKGYTVGVINGGVTKPERARIRKGFDAGTIQVLLVQIKTGKFAMNLSKADTCIYYSNSWEYEDRSQSEERTTNMAKAWVLVIDLITRNSVDEDVVDALKEKGLTSQQFRSKLLGKIAARFGPTVGVPRRQHVTIWKPGTTT